MAQHAGQLNENVAVNLLLRYCLDELRERGSLMNGDEVETAARICETFKQRAMRGRSCNDGAQKAAAGWLAAFLRGIGDDHIEDGICKLSIKEVAETLGLDPARHSSHCKQISKLMGGAQLPGQKSARASQAYRERQNRIWCEKKGGTFLPESPAASAALPNVHEGLRIAHEFDPCQALIEKEEPGKAFRPKLPNCARQT